MNTGILMHSKELQQQFINVYSKSRVTLVVSGTGTGKTVTVGMLINKHSNQRVMVGEPRILNAIGAVEGSKAVHGFTNCGYQTALESSNTNAEVMFVTDGLLSANTSMIGDVLIIDEVHEFNSNQELLLNFARVQLSINPNFKLVLMSATVDSKVARIREYFAADGVEVSTVNFEGRGFPIEFIARPKENIYVSTLNLLNAGKDTMVFVAGKGEGIDFETELKKHASEGVFKLYDILHLNGESDKQTRRAVTTNGSKPRLWIATNAAQAGVTPANLSAVLMTGLKKIIVTKNGYECLETVSISKEDMEQQKGRCGRLFAGIAQWHGNVPVEYLEDETAAEILRIDLTGFVLNLSARGINALEARFVNQPSLASISAAIATLKLLGALDACGKITSLGNEMNKISLTPRRAFAVVVAKKYGVLESMVKVMSLCENNLVFAKEHAVSNSGTTSVAISMLAKYDSIKTMTYVEKIYMLNAKVEKRVVESNAMIFRALGFVRKDTGDTEQLRKAIAASAADQVFKLESTSRNSWSVYTNIFTGQSASCKNFAHDFITGSVRGNGDKLFIDTPTVIEKEWLLELYADKVVTTTSEPEFEYHYCINCKVVTKIGNFIISTEKAPAVASEQTTAIVAKYIDGRQRLEMIVSEFNAIATRAGIDFDKVNFEQKALAIVKSKYGITADTFNSKIEDADYNLVLEHTDLNSLEELVALANTNNPTNVAGCTVKYDSSNKATVIMWSGEENSLNDSDFAILKSKVFEINGYRHNTLAEYKEKTAGSRRANEFNTLEANCERNAVKIEATEVANIPVTEVVGEFGDVYFKALTFGRLNWNDCFYVALFEKKEQAESAYNNAASVAREQIETSNKRILEIREQRKESELADKNRYADYKVEKYADAVDCEVKEEEEFFYTHKVSFQEQQMFNEETSAYEDTVMVTYNKQYFYSQEDAQKVCDESNYHLSLVDDSFDAVRYSERNTNDYCRLIVDGKICNYGDENLNVVFVSKKGHDVYCFVNSEVKRYIAQFDEEPNAETFDNTCEILEQATIEMWNAFEIAVYSYSSKLQSMKDNLLNVCFKNNKSKAIEQFDALYTELTKKIDFVHPLTSEEAQQTSINESLAKLIAKFNSK